MNRVFIPILIALLLLSTIGPMTGVSVAANTPPYVASVEMDSTAFYRVYQTITGKIYVGDNETTNPGDLDVMVTITYSGGLTVSFEPTYYSRRQYYLINQPLTAGVPAGPATLTITVTDPEGLSNSTSIEIVILDHTQIEELRAEVKDKFALVKASVMQWTSQGFNLSSVEAKVSQIEEQIKTADTLLLSAGDVDGAVALYEDALAMISDVDSSLQTLLKVYSETLKAKSEAMVAIETAKAIISSFEAQGYDVTQAKNMLDQAVGNFTEGVKAMEIEGAPGAQTFFATAKALAEYAVDLVKSMVSIEVDNMKMMSSVYEKLGMVRAEADKAYSYVMSLNSLGIDVSSSITLLQYVFDSLDTIESQLSPETAASAMQLLDSLSSDIDEAVSMANDVASEYANTLLTIVKNSLNDVSGRFMAPDVSTAKELLNYAQDSIDKGDYVSAIRWLNLAMEEIRYLDLKENISSSTVVMGIAIIIATLTVFFFALRMAVRKS